MGLGLLGQVLENNQVFLKKSMVSKHYTRQTWTALTFQWSNLKCRSQIYTHLSKFFSLTAKSAIYPIQSPVAPPWLSHHLIFITGLLLKNKLNVHERFCHGPHIISTVCNGCDMNTYCFTGVVMSECFLLHCAWPCFYQCFGCLLWYLFFFLAAPTLCLNSFNSVVFVLLCLVFYCGSGIAVDPCVTDVFVQLLLCLVAPALWLTPALRVFCAFHHSGVNVVFGRILRGSPTSRRSVISFHDYSFHSHLTPSHLKTTHSTHVILHTTHLTQFDPHNQSHTTHLAPLISHPSSHNPHFTQFISHHASHKTHPTPPIHTTFSHNFLTQLVSHHVSHTPSALISRILSRTTQNLTCGVFRSFFSLVHLFLCLVVSCCSGLVFATCFTGVLRISSYVSLSFVAPVMCSTAVLRIFCLVLLQHCVCPFLFLMGVLCVWHCVWPCVTGVLRVSSYVLWSLVAPALCLIIVNWRFVSLFLCLDMSCCSGIVFDPCFTAVLVSCVSLSTCILLSVVAPALCLTSVFWVFCVSLLMSCYLLLLRHCVWPPVLRAFWCLVYLSLLKSCHLLLLRHCVWPLLFGCFVYLFLCLVISCCSSIVCEPLLYGCFGVLCISLCLCVVISCCSGIVFDPCFTGCFVYLFSCLNVSCCAGIVFDRFFTGVLYISSDILFFWLLRHCVWALLYGCLVYLLLCLVISCCFGIVVDHCFTGFLCISCYVLLSLVAPALWLTPVLRVFCVSLAMSCYLLLLRHCG